MKGYSLINKKIILRLLGYLLLLESFFMAISMGVSLLYNEDTYISFLLTITITLTIGLLTVFTTRKAEQHFSKREGYIIVSIVWVILSLFGALPFVLSRAIPSYTDAFFETISGFTTTGASILNNIEELPKGILFWRSIIQWMGGMGIIVLSLAILPFLGIGGVQLFTAEVPGVTADKLHPHVKETAQRLWLIYVGFTLLEALLLYFNGMTIFDAINHSFTTMATGGYSTKQSSIAYYTNPAIQYIIILFMFIAGVNFNLSYFAIKLNFKKIIKNEEFRFYVFIILFFSAIVAAYLYLNGTYDLELAIRNSLFQVISIVTTTGYITDNYLDWAPLLVGIIFLLMFVGGSSGSTAGGVKVIRILMVIKNTYAELKRIMHPKAVIPTKISGKGIPQQIINNVLAFIVIYVLIFFIGFISMSVLGLDMDSAMGAVATSLGNIGPGLGIVGPVDNFATVPAIGKWILSALMLLGRLELFTVIIVFTPVFWKK